MIDDRQETKLTMLRRADWERPCRLPPVGLGLSSVILGAIGLMLFIVPVIGIPVSIAGIAVGATGIVVSLLGGQVSLRLCVAGVLLSLCGLLIIAAIARAPHGYFAPRSVFPALQPAGNRPYIPPPAAPQSASYQP